MHVFLCFTAASHAVSITPGAVSGYALANFSICGEVATSGQYLARVLYNPAQYQQWLAPVGFGQMTVFDSRTGLSLTDRQFSTRTPTRKWPKAGLMLSDSRMSGLQIQIHAFAPCAYNNLLVTSIPGLFGEITVQNTSATPATVEIGFEFAPDSPWNADTFTTSSTTTYYALRSTRFGIAFDRPTEYTPPSAPEGNLRLSRRMTIGPGGSQQARLLVLLRQSNGYYAPTWATWDSLAAYCFANWETLRAGTDDVDQRMPSVGDPTLDEYCRWYAVAGVALTKTLADGNVLTMGYTELNQRDSFWTSWIHLFLWPAADKKMLQLTRQHQRADGKIPTTILPVIERETDIDINEYYVLRAFRHFAWNRDQSLMAELWPSVRNAIQYLINRDTNGDRVPDTVDNSYWADWKDVWAYMHRKYGGHFCLLWLAVLRDAMSVAERLGEISQRDVYQSLYNQARASIDAGRTYSGNGLWTGRQYGNLWKGGLFYPDDRVLEDQTIGGVFGVLDPTRARAIFDALVPNEQPWGVRETYPYYPTDFLPNPGQYHNGAVWPWLNFADAFARFRYGYPNEAERIIGKVGYYDLVWRGDYLPHETLHGENAQNLQHEIQGWNAGLVGSLYFGALGVERAVDGTLRMFPRVDPARTFSFSLSLPEGRVMWEQRPVGRNVRAILTNETGYSIPVIYGFRIPAISPLRGQGDLNIGECEFATRTGVLAPSSQLTLSLEPLGAQGVIQLR